MRGSLEWDECLRISKEARRRTEEHHEQGNKVIFHGLGTKNKEWGFISGHGSYYGTSGQNNIRCSQITEEQAVKQFRR